MNDAIARELVDVLAELRTATDSLRDEVRALRLLFKDVIDPGANENFPGYIRTKDISRD